MKNIFKISLLFTVFLCLSNCSDDDVTANEDQEDADHSRMGYAHPDGVLVLNGGARMLENGSLTYIAPDGTVETEVYKKANGTELGNDAVDLFMHKDKIYILCNDAIQLDGHPGDGAIIIADAVTLKKEKAFKLSELVYEVPEGMRPGAWPTLLNFSNIAVLDEDNIFFSDAQALFHFNPNTAKLTIVEGSYHKANAGGTIEPKIARKSMAVVDGKLYMGTGGFWSDAGVYEFVKNKTELNRSVSFESGNLISGIVAGENGTFWVATYSRINESRNEVYKMNAEAMQIADSKNITADIFPGYGNTSGVSVAGNVFYHTGKSTVLQRFSFQNPKAKTLVDVKSDEPNANYINCNVVVNPKNNYVYVAASEDNYENVKAQNNLLIYDCSGDEAVLKQNIDNQTSYVAGIFCLSKFYQD